MPLIECPDCNKEVSDKAISCSSCGHPFKSPDSAAADVTGHGIPALFSFFVPGLGQLIKGDLLGVIAPYVLGYFAFQIFDDSLHRVLALIAIWVWQLVEVVAPALWKFVFSVSMPEKFLL